MTEFTLITCIFFITTTYLQHVWFTIINATCNTSNDFKFLIIVHVISLLVYAGIFTLLSIKVSRIEILSSDKNIHSI